MKNVSNSIVKKHLRFSKNVVTLRPLRFVRHFSPAFGGEQERAAAVAIFTETLNARMAELVDALVSGTSVGYDVQVRVLFRAHIYCAGGEIGIHATLRG